MQTRYRFFSDTNQTMFVRALEASKIEHGVAGYVVTVSLASPAIEGLAADLGGERLDDEADHSTTGVDPFLDIHATAYRAVAETPYTHEDNPVDKTKIGLKAVKTKRRSTRGQPDDPRRI